MREHQSGRRDGIKAIVLYPMNALASDQAGRFAEEILKSDLLSYDAPGDGGTIRKARVRVGLYTGRMQPGQEDHSGDGANTYKEVQVIAPERSDGSRPDGKSAYAAITDRQVMQQNPPDILLARWYCPVGRRTFSLLPDCFAARLSGILAEVEAVVHAVEQAAGLEAACQELRLDIELPGALRWVRRRVQAVHASLHLLKGLLAELFATCPATLTAFSERLGVGQVLLALRHIGACTPGSKGSITTHPIAAWEG